MTIVLPGLNIWLTTLLASVTLIGVLAGLWAFNRYYARSISDVQQRVITALQEENSVLTRKVSTLTSNVAKMQATITTIRIALKRQGIDITIDDDAITLRQRGRNRTVTVRVQQDMETLGDSRDGRDGRETNSGANNAGSPQANDASPPTIHLSDGDDDDD